MKRSILAALIAVVSLSAMVYAVPALVAGPNFRLLQEAHAQVTINNISGGGSVGSTTPAQSTVGATGPAGPAGPAGATGSEASGGSTGPTGQPIGPGQVLQVNPGISTLIP